MLMGGSASHYHRRSPLAHLAGPHRGACHGYPSRQSLQVTPNWGPADGGTHLTLTGAGFTGATAVTFGSTVISEFTIVSDTQITTSSPAGSGTVDITVTTPAGPSATSSVDQFTYTTPMPTITGLKPNSGSEQRWHNCDNHWLRLYWCLECNLWAATSEQFYGRE